MEISTGIVKSIAVQNKGIVTLPREIRARYHLATGSLLIVESRPDGILLKPSVPLPIEFYSEDRIQEFLKDDDALSEADLNAVRHNIRKPRTHRAK